MRDFVMDKQKYGLVDFKHFFLGESTKYGLSKTAAIATGNRRKSEKSEKSQSHVAKVSCMQ